jgi:hypothetical protein
MNLAAAQQARTKLTETLPHYRAQVTLASSGRKLEQISADYRQRLQSERADNSDKLDKTQQELLVNGVRHALSPGMQVTAEIHLGTRTILEYLLLPVTGAFQEAGRER